MELRPCGLAVLLAVVEAAVVDGEADSRKRLKHVRRPDPVGGVFRVVVVAVHGKAVGGQEVVAVAVVVLVLRAHVVVADSRLQAVRVQDGGLVRVGAVAGVPGEVRAVEGEHQSYTSFDSSSSTLVMNFSARIVVSSSQSPPRVTSKPSQPYRVTIGLMSMSVLPRS